MPTMPRVLEIPSTRDGASGSPSNAVTSLKSSKPLTKMAPLKVQTMRSIAATATELSSGRRYGRQARE
eukprot:1285395-Prymnesium_polylepis.1